MSLRMSFVRCARAICLILSAICFTGCGDSYGDFLNDPDNAGEAQWATTVKIASSVCIFNAVAVDTQGNSYAVGFVFGSGSFDFGGNSKEFKGVNSRSSAVIVKYNTSGVAQWVVPIEESPDDSDFNGVAVDESGNVYAAGYVIGKGWYNFGGKSNRYHCNADGMNAVIVKYNSNGIAQWAKPVVDSKGQCDFIGIAVDKDGNSYAVGNIVGQDGFDFGGSRGYVQYPVDYPVDNPDDVDTNAVIVKYNTSGDTQWAKTVVSASYLNGFSGVSVDEDGSAYAVGSVQKKGSFSFVEGGTGFSGKFDGVNPIIVKYNTDGIAQWERSVEGATSFSLFNGVAADRRGSVYAVGYVYGNGSFNFGGMSEPFQGRGSVSGNSVIVKYSTSGLAQWAVPIEVAEGGSGFGSVAVDILGNAYAAGHISDSALFDFGGNSLPFSSTATKENGVIVKYNSEGVPQWATPVKSDIGGSTFHGIAVDRSGCTYVAGGIDDNDILFDFGGEISPVYGKCAGDKNSSTVVVKYY